MFAPALPGKSLSSFSPTRLDKQWVAEVLLVQLSHEGRGSFELTLLFMRMQWRPCRRSLCLWIGAVERVQASSGSKHPWRQWEGRLSGREREGTSAEHAVPSQPIFHRGTTDCQCENNTVCSQHSWCVLTYKPLSAGTLCPENCPATIV